jgi:hypothetical protein
MPTTSTLVQYLRAGGSASTLALEKGWLAVAEANALAYYTEVLFTGAEKFYGACPWICKFHADADFQPFPNVLFAVQMEKSRGASATNNLQL